MNKRMHILKEIRKRKKEKKRELVYSYKFLTIFE
jgi:hypothetical protein